MNPVIVAGLVLLFVGLVVAIVLQSGWNERPRPYPTGTVHITISADSSGFRQGLAYLQVIAAAKGQQLEFERSMARIRRVVSLTRDELEQLAEAYKALGAGE